jgi:hypothetical protein
MGKRVAGFLVVIAAAGLVPATAASGAPSAAKTVDACSLLTDEVAGSAATPYTIDDASGDQGVKGNCVYSLTSSEKTGEPLIVGVGAPSQYNIEKAITKKTKATKGIGTAGFTGVDGAGDTVLDFKTKTASVRIAGEFDTATLITFAKGIQKQLK